MPVIVVKENERLVAHSKNKSNKLRDNRNYVFENYSHSFYFMDDCFNREKTSYLESAWVPMLPDHIDAKLKQAYSLNAVSQRDYVYYGILNPSDQGPLDANYAEYLTNFLVSSPSSLSYAYDDPTTDWSDGAMEFQIDILFFNGSSALTKISKVVSIPNSELISNGTMQWYKFPTPIMIATWDMEKMGDTWKYVVNELDPGTVTTTTHVSTSKFGINFSFNATLGKVVKLGIGFGGSGEITSSHTTQIQVTTGSDFCGEAAVNFLNPIITAHGTIPTPGPGPDRELYGIEQLNTGIIQLIVQPRRIG